MAAVDGITRGLAASSISHQNWSAASILKLPQEIKDQIFTELWGDALWVLTPFAHTWQLQNPKSSGSQSCPGYVFRVSQISISDLLECEICRDLAAFHIPGEKSTLSTQNYFGCPAHGAYSLTDAPVSVLLVCRQLYVEAIKSLSRLPMVFNLRLQPRLNMLTRPPMDFSRVHVLHICMTHMLETNSTVLLSGANSSEYQERIENLWRERVPQLRKLELYLGWFPSLKNVQIITEEVSDLILRFASQREWHRIPFVRYLMNINERYAFSLSLRIKFMKTERNVKMGKEMELEIQDFIEQKRSCEEDDLCCNPREIM